MIFVRKRDVHMFVRRPVLSIPSFPENSAVAGWLQVGQV